MNQVNWDDVGRELQEFENFKQPVMQAWNRIMHRMQIKPETKWLEFGALCAAHPWFQVTQNKYHNAVHTAQVMWCGMLLAPTKMIDEDDTWFPKFILSLMFHDVGHTGEKNTFKYQSELVACGKFEIYMNANPEIKHIWDHYLENKNGSWFEMIEFVKRIILATETTENVPENIKNYLDKETHTLMDVVLVLASEADLLPSIIPVIGEVNAQKLAEEEGNIKLGTKKGRLEFFQNVKYVSAKAKQLGINELILNECNKLKEQIQVEEKK